MKQVAHFAYRLINGDQTKYSKLSKSEGIVVRKLYFSLKA